MQELLLVAEQDAGPASCALPTWAVPMLATPVVWSLEGGGGGTGPIAGSCGVSSGLLFLGLGIDTSSLFGRFRFDD